MFLRELHPDIPQLKVAFRSETQHLSEEAAHQLWISTQERWIAEHTSLQLSGPGDDDGNQRNLLYLGVAELAHEIASMQSSIADLQLPTGLGEYDTAAFAAQYTREKALMRLKIRACQEILERIRARCLYYANRLESQLAAEAHTSDLVGEVQREVHNFYAERCDAAFQSLKKAASLLGSTDAEDHALLLTSVRRAVRAVADYHCPPLSEPVTCADGKVRELGEEQYLNRLHEYCMRQSEAGASTSLLRAEFELLAQFVRRLNDVASKGVHAQVSPFEARQGLFGIYLFLSNVITKLNTPAAQTASLSTNGHD
jgi:hypothetical protein